MADDRSFAETMATFERLEQAQIRHYRELARARRAEQAVPPPITSAQEYAAALAEAQSRWLDSPGLLR
jgi:hypothetical protein